MATLSGSRFRCAESSAWAITSRLVASARTWLTTALASACARGVASAATMRACAVYVAGWSRTYSASTIAGIAIARASASP